MSRRCFAQRSVHLAGPSSVAQSPLSVPRPWRAGSKSSPSPNSPVIYYSSEASCEWIELAYKNFILSVPRSFLLAWLRLMSITADLSALGGCDDVRIKKLLCVNCQGLFFKLNLLKPPADTWRWPVQHRVCHWRE